MITIYYDGFVADRMDRMAQSNKERQEALRARRAMLGMTEVRGIYLPPELHAALKAHAKKLMKAHKPKPNWQPVGYVAPEQLAQVVGEGAHDGGTIAIRKRKARGFTQAIYIKQISEDQRA